MITREQCNGCEDDFYNVEGHSMSGRCWSAKTGKMKVRYRTGTWTMPASPGAFTKVRVPTCYRQKWQHYSDRLPDFVKAGDVVRPRKETR